MKELLKAILDCLNREQTGFTDIESVHQYSDSTITIAHTAKNPDRKIEVCFDSLDEAMSYVKSF